MTTIARIAVLLCSIGMMLAADLSLVLNDPLTGDGTVGIETDKRVTGGQFVTDGWQSTGSSSQLRIAIPDSIFTADRSGAMEVDIRNFDPVAQYSGSKHQFINMYSRPDGSKSDWLNEDKNWWNIRGGTNYMSNGGGGFKFLYARRGVDNRHEHRLIQSRNDWYRSQTYTFRVEWTPTSIIISLDGKVLKANGQFHDRVEALDHVFLGKDSTYSGMKTSDGIVYQRLRLYAESTGPVPTRRIQITSSHSASWTIAPDDGTAVVDGAGAVFNDLNPAVTYFVAVDIGTADG